MQRFRVGFSFAYSAIVILLVQTSVRCDDRRDESPNACVAEFQIARGGDLPLVTIESLGKQLQFLVNTSEPTTYLITPSARHSAPNKNLAETLILPTKGKRKMCSTRRR